MVNVAHRRQRSRDARGPYHGQLAALLSGQRRAPASAETIAGHVRHFRAQAADERRAEHRGHLA